MKRPSWHEYFIEMTQVISKRSTCLRRQVGAIIVKDNQILASGYNGAPSKVTHCEVTGCLRQKLNIPSGERQEICRGLHAEQNAIIQAAVHGVSVTGATIYCTNKPCSICAKMIINAHISRIIYMEDYNDALSEELLGETDIRIMKFDKAKV